MKCIGIFWQCDLLQEVLGLKQCCCFGTFLFHILPPKSIEIPTQRWKIEISPIHPYHQANTHDMFIDATFIYSCIQGNWKIHSLKSWATLVTCLGHHSSSGRPWQLYCWRCSFWDLAIGAKPLTMTSPTKHARINLPVGLYILKQTVPYVL